MTIGSKFLERVLTEAKKDDKKYTFSRGTEAMKRSLRDIGGEDNIADKIAEIMDMVGIPGTFINKPDLRDGLVEAAMTIRTKPARYRSFLALHSALSTFHGVTPIVEAKVEKKEYSEEELEGSQFQQLIEEVLVSLGVPAEMVSGDGKPAVKNGLKRMAARLRADTGVRAALLAYARYSNIKVGDAVVGIKKPGVKKPVAEAAEPVEKAEEPMNHKDAVQTVRTIAGLMGIEFTDKRQFSAVNVSALERAMKLRARDPKVKRAMAAFMRAYEA